MNKKSWNEIQDNITKRLLLVISSVSIVAAIFQMVTEGGSIGSMVPLGVSILAGGMYFLSTRGKLEETFRIILLVFFSIIFVPALWITTSGSQGPVVLFSLIVPIMVFILSKSRIEKLLPYITMLQVFIMLVYEKTYPGRMFSYRNQDYRLLIMILGFACAFAVIMPIMSLLRKSLDESEDKYDLQTGLLTRSHMLSKMNEHTQAGRKGLAYMIKVSGLDECNASLGYEQTDKLLAEFGRSLDSLAKENISVGTYTTSSYIACFIDGIKQEYEDFAESINEKFSVINAKSGGTLKLTVSYDILFNKSTDEILRNIENSSAN